MYVTINVHSKFQNRIFHWHKQKTWVNFLKKLPSNLVLFYVILYQSWFIMHHLCALYTAGQLHVTLLTWEVRIISSANWKKMQAVFSSISHHITQTTTERYPNQNCCSKPIYYGASNTTVMFLGVRLCNQNLNLTILPTVHTSYRSIMQNMHGQTARVPSALECRNRLPRPNNKQGI